MAAKRTETGIAKVGTGPTWIAKRAQELEAAGGDQSLAALKKHRVLSRLKVLQSLTKNEKYKKAKQAYGEGAAIMAPACVPVASLGESFLCVPVFAFTQFQTWRDIDDSDTPRVTAKSFSWESEVARLSQNEKTRQIPYEDGRKNSKGEPLRWSNVAHLNFVVYIFGDHPLAGELVTVDFNRGEYFTGESWSTAIQMRKIDGYVAPMWSQVWRLTPAEHNNSKHTWFGLDYASPGLEEAWVPEEMCAFFESQYEELAKLFADRLLDVEEDDDVVTVNPLDSELAAEI